ncbi:MAG: hypothetical protein M3Q44_03425 [bacterium]|nr:hypothetical protein [bacterium]
MLKAKETFYFIVPIIIAITYLTRIPATLIAFTFFTPTNGLSELIALAFLPLAIFNLPISSIIAGMLYAHKKLEKKKLAIWIVISIVAELIMSLIRMRGEMDYLTLFALPLLILPYLLLGIILGLTPEIIPKIKSITAQQFLLGAGIALYCGIVLTNITGVFKNNITVEKNEGNVIHYYVHRGLPTSFAGVASKEATIEFPLVRIDLMNKTFQDGSVFYRIIDVPAMASNIIFFTLVSLILSIIFAISRYGLKIKKTGVYFALAFLVYSFWILGWRY